MRRRRRSVRPRRDARLYFPCFVFAGIEWQVKTSTRNTRRNPGY
ncbi:MAG TPA: hypothetical protein PK411_11055 [Mesotoga infera]|nr:hypothetical protein [Mesotoga infera]HRR44025.1 hypothetical protein [Mesotoga sp.]HRV01759.1 hypothetical protein [Mesotoga sp.]